MFNKAKTLGNTRSTCPFARPQCRQVATVAIANQATSTSLDGAEEVECQSNGYCSIALIVYPPHFQMVGGVYLVPQPTLQCKRS